MKLIPALIDRAETLNWLCLSYAACGRSFKTAGSGVTASNS